MRPGRRTDLRLPGSDCRAGPGCTGRPTRWAVLRGTAPAGDEGSAWIPLESADADVTVEQEPNNTLEQATPAKVPGVLCGVLGEPCDHDVFRLDLAKDQKIRIRAEARPFNSPADLEIVLTDAKGQELRRASDAAQEDVVNLEFTAPAAGAYGLMVRDLERDGGPAFTYRLDVRSGPQLAVTADVEGLTVPQGGYQPVPLTVVRTDYAGPVTLTLVGAPPGVTLTPNEIPAGVDAVVCKLNAGPDAPIGVYSPRIFAQPGGLADAPRFVVRTHPMIDRQLMNVDLILYAPARGPAASAARR